MATNPIIDAEVARQQLRHLRGRKDRLQEERAVLQAAETRLAQIRDELDCINAEIDRIKLRDPEDPGQAATPRK